MASLLHFQHFKALFFFAATAYELLRLPFTLSSCSLPFLRPIPQWTFRQSLMTYIVRRTSIYTSLAATDIEPWDLTPKAEGSRFQLIPRSSLPIYLGPLASPSTQPIDIGGVWHPTRPSASQHTSLRNGHTPVVLHFHGSGFARGTYRDRQCGPCGSNLARLIGPTFCAAYRLTLQGFAYPAALQDAITAYSWLLHEVGVPAEKIVVSGDSAGGNLAIALLRYTQTDGAAAGLAAPGNVLLWSPAVDLADAVGGSRDVPEERWATDFLTREGLRADMRAYVEEADARDPYISPVDEPFRTKAKIWVHAGGVEALVGQIGRFVENMRRIGGNEVEYSVTPYAMHDIFTAGWALGFKEEAERQVELAAKFIGTVREGSLR